MRIVSFVVIICLSLLASGQKIIAEYTDTLLYDNFSGIANNFPQKYNAFELLIIEDGSYRIKRISNQSSSIALDKSLEGVDEFQLVTHLALAKSKNKEASGGIVVHAQTTINGAICIEINTKKQFKITKLFDNQLRYLSGQPANAGWVKFKHINKKGTNKIMVKVKSGYYEVYFNDKFAYSVFDKQYIKGKVGFYIGSESEMVVDDIIVLGTKIQGLPIANKSTSSGGDFEDDNFQEVVKLFKDKIDEQQKTIDRLQSEVDKCRSMLNYDTSLVSRSKELEIMNKMLTTKLDSATNELRRNSKRLAYLESLKEDIEAESNGDLVLNLTSILAEVKADNKALKQQLAESAKEKETLKTDNVVLIREIERLKYLLNIQD
jgi:hypothetical protein